MNNASFALNALGTESINRPRNQLHMERYSLVTKHQHVSCLLLLIYRCCKESYLLFVV